MRQRVRLVVGAGAAWGFFCAEAGGVPVATTLAQMAMPWAWIAALAGLGADRSAKRAAVYGGLALLVANLCYFLVRFVERLAVTGDVDANDVRFLAFWTTVGVLVGPVAGVLGKVARSETGAIVGMVALAGASVAEPLAWWWHVTGAGPRLAYAIVALLGLGAMVLRFVEQPRKLLTAMVLTLSVLYPISILLEAILITTQQVSMPFRLV